MNVRLLAAVFGVILPSALWATEEPSGGRVSDSSPADLIRLLGDESYPLRESATYDLWALGQEAEELLEEAAASDNPEVSLRARSVLRKIQLGILPDSPPEVVALVVRYDGANPEDRLKIIRRLKQLRAWRQVLRIHELERDPATLEKIAGEMNGVSVEAARELLAGEEPDFDKAREMLEMGRPEPAQLMALAAFHRVAGSLEAELARAADLEGEAGHMWRYALLAAKGDLLGAANEAEFAGMGMIGARLRALAGDPLPWVMKAPIPPQEIVPETLPSYRNAVVRMWSHRPVSKDLIEELVDDCRQGDIDKRFAALSVLYAMGENEAADRELLRNRPELASFYFDSVERVDEALSAIGLDPEEADFKKWAEKRFKVVIGDPDDSDEELSELMTMGSFLEGRGLDELASEIITGQLVELGREDPEIFLDRINGMFSVYSYNRMVGPVLEAAAIFAKEDPVKLVQVRDSLFGEAIHVPEMWASLGSFDPEMSGGERLRLLAEVLGTAPGKRGGIDEWWKYLEDQSKNAREAEQENALALMLCVGVFRRDSGLFLEAVGLMRELGKEFHELGTIGDNYSFGGFENECLIAVGRWEEVVERRQALASRAPAAPILRAALAVALRRAGKEDEAVKHEKVIERLALGDVRSMRAIARAYSSGGDFRRAGDWWLRAAIETTGTIQEFNYAATALLSEAKEQGDWKMVASLGEVMMLFKLMVGSETDNPWTVMRMRLETDMARALAAPEEDRERSLSILERCFRKGGTDGSMADYFFPGLRQAGLIEQHDEWFEETWAVYNEVLEAYPGSHNTCNTAAWTAARANRRLDEAEDLSKRALETLPNQSAYLDTYGEIWFCRRNREKALEWSAKALRYFPDEPTIMRQYERFRTGEFPLR